MAISFNGLDSITVLNGTSKTRLQAKIVNNSQVERDYYYYDDAADDLMCVMCTIFFWYLPNESV